METQSNTNAYGSNAPLTKGQDLLTIIALLVGGIVLPLVGWFFALFLLIRSPSWNLRQKLIGAVLPPFGYFPLVAVLLLPSLTNSCVESKRLSKEQAISCAASAFSYSGPEIFLLILLTILPTISAIYLYRTASG